ncbi:MAG: protoporphyrinogen oxidase [Alicyclobacillus herbarius]|uniref:protoporphyrinogen oxidase n=1 Tax=Alicyclobacillus herbarius TaxID=122960 RepID=UPI00235451E4|nr:protoporphyrinogen oxidase [Alicyclobacillus herbarius]MCL6632840.1 protoporphyrinogen oxidase [Alicyclobacillus herbarius]
MTLAKRVVIVGGGISGLACAFYLQQMARDAKSTSFECTVLEADGRLGGKLFTYREDGFILEGGPDSMLVRKPAGIGLVRSLGIEAELVPSGSGVARTYVVSRGKLALLPSGTNMGIPAHWDALWGNEVISARGKWRALRDLVLPPMREEGDVSVGAFLRRRLGDEWVDRLCEPLLAGIYAGRADSLSLEATFPQFRRLEREYGSLMLGSAAERRRRAAQARAQGPAAAAAVSATPGGRSAFVALRGGFSTLVERLYDELHTWAKLYTKARVESVHQTEDGRYCVAFTTPTGAQNLTADAVIIAAPAFVAAELLKPWLDRARYLADIPYVSTATVSLAYRSENLPVLDASGFLAPRVEQRLMTASTWLSTKWPHTTPHGYAVLRCFVGRAGQEEGLDLDDAEMIRRIRQELAELVGITAQPVFTRVTRWVKAMPQYGVGHLGRLQAVEQELTEKLPGVFLTGAGYRGVGIPDCIAQAQTAVEQTLNYLHQHASSSPHAYANR